MVFLKLENVLSPGGSLRKQLLRGPIVFNSRYIPWRESALQLLRGPIVFNLCFIGVRNGTGGFKNTDGESPF